MSLDMFKELGNTTPSLSLIVSLITGVSIIVTGIVCKKHQSSVSNDEECKSLPYVGVAIIAIGTALFYVAQTTDLASYEGLWIVLSAVVTSVILYRANQ